MTDTFELSSDFEPILLKKLTYNGEFFGKCMPILKQKYFSGIGNQQLFGLVLEYYAAYRQIPTLTELISKVKNVSNGEIRKEIIESLQKINKTEEVENTEFMLDETVTWVKDALYMEALQVGSDGLMKKDDALKLKSQQIMDERSKVSVNSDLGLDFDDIDLMIEYYTEKNIGIKTQHAQLNKRIGAGFLPKTLSIILAASGIGKSLLMTDLISGMIKDGKKVLLVSLEMADKELMKRVHANAMDLPINSLIDLSKSDAELEAIYGKDFAEECVTKEMVLAAYNKLKTSGTCGKLFIKEYPTGSLTPLMLEQLIESYRIEQNIEFDIVFVDYLGIMKSDLLSASVGLYSYVKSIAEELRAVAVKLLLPIISASQLNRGAVNNIKEADNANVSDSMGTVMIADFLMFLLQNEEMKAKGEIVCKITKNRFGGFTDTWSMGINYIHMRFRDLVVQDSAANPAFTDTSKTDSNPLDDDFGIITPEKQEAAKEFADQEVKDIIREDTEILMKADNPDPFLNDADELFRELGID